MKILYTPCFLKKNFPLSKLKKSLQKIPYSRIGLFSTLQHLNQLGQVKNFLESEGKKVILGGQILGCDTKKIKGVRDKVDAFLYLGPGKFHPLGIAINSNKPVFILKPYSCSIDKISEKEIQKYERKRKGAIGKASEAKLFGVLVSLKTGQFHFSQAKKIKEKLEEKGRKAFLFAGDEISPERLLGFKVDTWINTACPRITEDYFDKPVLNPEELEIIL